MSSPTYYFGYGSNLWLHQMSLRCPSSPYVGLARLSHYRWMINSRGYANVVQTNSPSDIVYGLIYTLTSIDEASLDENEGVPDSYTKEYLVVDFWPLEPGEKADVDGSGTGSRREEMLVYIDRRRVEDGRPREEYVHRMNRGVQDAVRVGVPGEYVEGVIRRFIPAEGDPEAEVMAEKQAVRFEDE